MKEDSPGPIAFFVIVVFILSFAGFVVCSFLQELFDIRISNTLYTIFGAPAVLSFIAGLTIVGVVSYYPEEEQRNKEWVGLFVFLFFVVPFLYWLYSYLSKK